MKNRLLPVGLTLGLVAVHSVGCVGYRLGTTLPPDIRTIQVPVFVNKTQEPLIENETTKAAIKELQKDGTLKVTDLQSADVVLEVHLTGYGLEPLRYDHDTSKRSTEYRVEIQAELILKRVGTDEVVIERRVEGEATFIPGGDLSLAKREVLPEVAKDLAHDIVESIVEYW